MTTWEDAVRELQEDSAKARAALNDALEAKKTIRASCTCGRKFDVPAKDHANAVKAADTLFRQGAELAKHLERLKETIPEDTNDRPLRHLTQKQLVARAKQAGLLNPDGTLKERAA